MKDWIDTELEAWDFIDNWEKKIYYAYVETSACKKAWIDENGYLYAYKESAACFSNIEAAKQALKKAEILCEGFGNKLKRKVIVNGEKEIGV